eukprot:Rhum_TRINITY_DN15268_c3_g1::Rhum_TRINITY_DN15268_c3_g1_i1::g.147494::m.147494
MTQRCLDCTAGLLDRWAYREGDSELQQQTKRILVLFLTVTSAASLVGFAGTIDHESPIRHYMPLFIFMFLAELGYLRVTRDAGERFIYVFTVSLTVTIMVNDIVSAVEAGRRMWPFAILLVDILLVIRASPALTIGVVSSMCVFMTVMQLEAALRIGLFDLVVFAPYEHRDGFEACAKPPCQGNSAFLTYMSGLLITMSVFLLDFYFTRGFALQVRREKEKIAAAVTAAEQVAESLALFDLDAAELVLSQSQQDMPPDLCESLRVVLSHLRAYKPFLPQSVFALAASVPVPPETDSESDSKVSSRHPPSLSSGDRTPLPSFNKRRLSLLHLNASLPDVSAPCFPAVHSQMLASVLKHAATCKGVVDHFCGDAVSLSYNASSQCARHPTMAVQTAAALCLCAESGSSSAFTSVVRGGVATGNARVGTMGVPELRRHCIVGMLDTVCQNIVQAAVILRHPLLCLRATAVDVTFCWQTRVLLDRVVFSDNLASLAKTQADDAADNAFSGCAGVVYEVLGAIGEAEGSTRKKSGGSVEWMYELEARGTSEWDAYNKAGLAFHRAGGNVAAGICELETTLVADESDRAALFAAAVSASRSLSFRPTLESPSSLT